MMIQKNEGVAALGLFDGVHLGHKRVLEKCAEYEKFGLVPMCFTFAGNTLAEKQNRKIQYIYSDEQKFRYIKNCGIKHIVCADFNDIRNLSSKEFVQNIIKNEMNCRCVVCGEDFRFGHGASADISDLKDICKGFGIEVFIVSQVNFGEIKVSSALVRKALSNGNINDANDLLGREFSICGKVFCDHQNGTKMGIPTINLKTTAPLRYGVYAASVILENKVYKGITNVGVRPTFYEDSDVVVETHILDFYDDIYEKEVEVVLKGFIRDEKRFENVEELKKQIMLDIDTLRLF